VAWTVNIQRDDGLGIFKKFTRHDHAVNFFEHNLYDAIKSYAGLDTSWGRKAYDDFHYKSRVKEPFTIVIKGIGFDGDLTTTEKGTKLSSISKKRNPKREATTKQLAWRKKFAAMAKAGKFTKKKRTRKNPAKRRLKSAPIRAKKEGALRRAARGRKKPLISASGGGRTTIKKNAKRRVGKGFVVRGTKPTKTGYSYYYLSDSKFITAKANATRYKTRSACNLRMRNIIKRLPFAIKEITCVAV